MKSFLHLLFSDRKPIETHAISPNSESLSVQGFQLLIWREWLKSDIAVTRRLGQS